MNTVRAILAAICEVTLPEVLIVLTIVGVLAH